MTFDAEHLFGAGRGVKEMYGVFARAFAFVAVKLTLICTLVDKSLSIFFNLNIFFILRINRSAIKVEIN